MKTWHSPLLASAIIALTACGGSSSSSNNSNDAAPLNPDNNGITYGRVIDGYLEDAFVCIDSNNDNQCSTTENPIQTDDQGRFNLTGLSNKTLIAQAIAGVTKDSDDNGVTIKQGFTLTASAEHGGIITPFTTLLMELDKGGLSKEDALTELSSNLNIPAADLLQNYVETNNSSMAKTAQLLVDTIQYISAQALQESESPGEDQLKIEALAWSQLTSAALLKLTELRQENSDTLPSELINLWIAAIPELNITKEEVSGSDPVDPDPVDPNPTDPDPVDPDPTPSDQFSKISAAGLELAADATDYACVIQNIDADGQAIPSVDRNTWMLLIPADATYADIGATPAGYTNTDLFWNYSWEPEANYPDTFKEANGLTSQYSAENQVEIYVELLNKVKYCGFSDWTVPSIVQIQSINTKSLQSDSNVKTLDKNVFKNFTAFETQVFNRSQANGGDVDPTNYHYKVNPFFWTSTRTEENGIPDTSIGDYKKYLHPTEIITSEEIFTETPGGGPYFALRAVRQDRFQRIAEDGTDLDLTSTDWQCVKDNDALGRRYWSNPIAELADIKYNDIQTTVSSFNNASKCGFNDWRLPTKQELLTLKPIHSDAYFHIGILKEDRNYNTYYHDYVWTQPKEGDDDEVVHLRMQSDYDLPHTSMDDDDDVKLILVRDDIASAITFDASIKNHTDQIAATDELKNNFDSITVDTSSTTEENIKAAFQTLATLPDLVKTREQSITATKAVLTIGEAQFSALYINVKTTERTNNLSTAQTEQVRIESAFIADAISLKIMLDDLFAQYDALSNSDGFSSNTMKAEVLNVGIGSASNILALLTDLGNTLGNDTPENQAAVETLITTRETEAESLPTVSLNGGFIKIAKDGDEAKASANYGDDWRCVKQVETVDDFTTTSYWSLLNEVTDSTIKRAAMNARLETINVESLCGISTWQIPDLAQLKNLSILDIITEDDEPTKTIDPSVFINHKVIADAAPQYWYSDSSGYVLRYATETQKEDDSVSVSSFSNTDIANARYTQQSISYLKTDMTCGVDAIIYQGSCYQAHNQELPWEEAKQSCIDNGQHLIAKEALTDKDYAKLAIGLNLISGSKYWLTKTLSQYSYPNYLQEDSNSNWDEKTYGTKTDSKSYICTGPAVALNKPAAPTSPSHDDDANTFSWTNVTGFNDATDYQYSLDNGVSWKDASANPVNVKNKNLTVGHVQVRVKSVEEKNPVGSILKSLQPYIKAEGLCSGGNAFASIDGDCYIRFDDTKNWSDAKAFCEADSRSLVSIDHANLNSLGSSLALDSSKKYWLLEDDHQYSGYAYYLHSPSSNWESINHAGTKSKSSSYSFICVE